MIREFFGMLTVHGCFPPPVILQRLIAVGFFLLRFIVGNLGTIKKLGGGNDTEKRYLRPPRRYDLPEYQPGIKSLARNHKYLRSTLYCNPHAPEIIAMATQLGAGRKPDWDFAQTVFEFIKRKNLLTTFNKF